MADCACKGFGSCSCAGKSEEASARAHKARFGSNAVVGEVEVWSPVVGGYVRLGSTSEETSGHELTPNPAGAALLGAARAGADLMQRVDGTFGPRFSGGWVPQLGRFERLPSGSGLGLAPPTFPAEAVGALVTDHVTLLTLQRGDCPIILTASHGGREGAPGVCMRETNPELPASTGGGMGLECRGGNWVVPDEPGIAGDPGTAEVTRVIAQAFREATGFFPYVVIAEVSRRYVDFNRERGACAFETIECFSPGAVYYDAFHDAIRGAIADATRLFSGAFLIDVHRNSNAALRGSVSDPTVEDLLIDPLEVGRLCLGLGGGGSYPSLRGLGRSGGTYPWLFDSGTGLVARLASGLPIPPGAPGLVRALLEAGSQSSRVTAVPSVNGEVCTTSDGSELYEGGFITQHYAGLYAGSPAAASTMQLEFHRDTLFVGEGSDRWPRWTVVGRNVGAALGGVFNDYLRALLGP